MCLGIDWDSRRDVLDVLLPFTNWGYDISVCVTTKRMILGFFLPRRC